jgi:glycosyltransferase involved in cell wall biosynthesis
MEALPRITVLLPVYNGGKYIRTAIHSILAQTHEDFELLIVDDGSTDNTKKVVGEFSDQRIRYDYIEHVGLSSAINYGLENASCDIVARMDADDISLPKRLETQLKAFIKQPPNTVMSCRYALFDDKGMRGVVGGPQEHEAIVKRLILHNELTHSGIMFNRNFILEQGGYPLVPFEDFVLWLQLRNKAHYMIVPDILTCARVDYSSLARINIAVQNKLVYEVHKSIYVQELFPDEFGLSSKVERDNMRGWREYFYGNKFTARMYWLKNPVGLLSSPRLLFAFAATFLPEQLFIGFKESRIRFRLKFYFGYTHELSAVEAVVKNALCKEERYGEE